MTSNFICMCEVDNNTSPMTGTLDLQTLLNTLIREDLSNDETPDWTAAQDMIFLGRMYEEAHKKTEQVAGVEPDTVRFFPTPNAETGEMDLAAITQTPDGRRFVLSGSTDFMETFAKHDHYIVMF